MEDIFENFFGEFMGGRRGGDGGQRGRATRERGADLRYNTHAIRDTLALPRGPRGEEQADATRSTAPVVPGRRSPHRMSRSRNR